MRNRCGNEVIFENSFFFLVFHDQVAKEMSERSLNVEHNKARGTSNNTITALRKLSQNENFGTPCCVTQIYLKKIGTLPKSGAKKGLVLQRLRCCQSKPANGFQVGFPKSKNNANS